MDAEEALCHAIINNKLLYFSNTAIYRYCREQNYYRCITTEEAVTFIAQNLSTDELCRLPSRSIPECIKRVRNCKELHIDMESAFKTHQMELNLQNGVYQIQSQSLRKYRENDIFDYVLNFAYNRNTSSRMPNFEKFISTSVREENRDCLMRSIGYVLSSLTQGKKAILLLGLPSTGKSVLMNLIGAAFPQELVTNERFHSMAKETAKASYVGKRLNLAREADSRAMRDEDGFKSLVSCEETSGRCLYENTKTIHPHIKFVIASNNDLNFAHPDIAIYERLVVIRFTQVISESQKDMDLEKRLLIERDYIFSAAIDTLKDLINSKYDFHMSKDAIAYLAHKRMELNSSREYLKDETELIETGTVSSVKLFASYCSWCKKNDLPPVGRNTFRSEVLAYSTQILPGKISDSGSIVRGYKGIRLKEETHPP